MQRKLYAVIGVSAALAVATACGRQGSSPVSPSGARPIVSVDEVAGANGATLKVTSPALVSPINDTVVADAQPTLVVSGRDAHESVAGRICAGVRLGGLRLRGHESAD